MKKSEVSRNIPLMYFIGSLMWGRFFIPVLALFYIASQVPIGQFAIIMSTFALFTLLFEIPSGVVADLLGKKKALLMGRFCYIIEIFMIAFFNGFWVFLIAKMISGAGVSLGSGTDSALLFDTLKKEKREKDYKKVSGRLKAICNLSSAFVFIIGAYLFSLHYKLPAIVSLPFISLGFVLTYFLKEPYPNGKKITLKNSFKHLKEGLIYFKNSNFVKFISLISLFSVAVISVMLSLSSVYFENIFIPISLMGVLAFISSIMMAISSKKAHGVEKKIGEKKSLFLIQFIILIAIFGMAILIPFYGVVFLFLISIVAGFSGVIIDDYVNRHIESSHRTTLLSIKNFFNNIGIFLLFPIVGYLIDIKSMQFSFMFLGLVAFVGYFIAWKFSKKWNINLSNNSKNNNI
ncbi:MAG: MFS transporter [archaeon]